MGLCSVTFLVLLVLKLTGIGEITWFWVFFPLAAIGIFWLVVVPSITMIGCVCETIWRHYGK
jgi:hypothetical protein